MKISALVLTKNEQQMIADCLKQLEFADEIIVLDQNSQDKTRTIAQKYTEKIYTTNLDDFDKNRNLLAQMAKGEWLLYIDADERIDSQLTLEIKRATAQDKYSAYYFPRKNLVLGRWLKHTGFWPDYVPRLFKRTQLITWQGRVHESPKVDGSFGYFKRPLVHLTARSLSAMLEKTRRWAKIEAELLKEANYPKVTIFRVAKALCSEFFSRFIKKAGFLDGYIGLVESIYQALHQAIVLTYLWELQNNVKIKSKKFQY